MHQGHAYLLLWDVDRLRRWRSDMWPTRCYKFIRLCNCDAPRDIGREAGGTFAPAQTDHVKVISTALSYWATSSLIVTVVTTLFARYATNFVQAAHLPLENDGTIGKSIIRRFTWIWSLNYDDRDLEGCRSYCEKHAGAQAWKCAAQTLYFSTHTEKQLVGTLVCLWSCSLQSGDKLIETIVHKKFVSCY